MLGYVDEVANAASGGSVERTDGVSSSRASRIRRDVISRSVRATASSERHAFDASRFDTIAAVARSIAAIATDKWSIAASICSRGPGGVTVVIMAQSAFLWH